MQQLQSLTNNYLNHCKYQETLNGKTIKAYSIDLKQFMSFQQNTDGLLSKENILNYISLLHSKYKPKSAKRKIACLRAFFNYLEFDEQITANPFSKIKVKFQEPKTLPRTIPINSIQEILSAAYKDLDLTKTNFQKSMNLRDIAVLECLFATGVRVSELCGLKKDSINLEDGILRIYGKGSRERIIQIGNKDVLFALRKYSIAINEIACKSDFFFINRFGNQLSEQSVRTLICKYTQKASIETKITPHMFRHSFATLLLEEDVDIRYIQQILGHSSIIGNYLSFLSVEKEKQENKYA